MVRNFGHKSCLVELLSIQYWLEDLRGRMQRLIGRCQWSLIVTRPPFDGNQLRVGNKVVKLWHSHQACICRRQARADLVLPNSNTQDALKMDIVTAHNLAYQPFDITIVLMAVDYLTSACHYCYLRDRQPKPLFIYHVSGT